MIVKGWTSGSSWPQLVYAGRHNLPDGRIVVVTARIHGFNQEFQLAKRFATQLPHWLAWTSSLAELWNVLNRALPAEMNEGNFVSCSVASYVPGQRELECAMFGPAEPILVPCNETSSKLPAARFPYLGILDDIDMTESYVAAPIRVQGGDTLVCHESVTHIWNSEQVEYGQERLERVVARAASAGRDAAAIADAVVSDCGEHCGHDWSDWPAALMVAVF